MTTPSPAIQPTVKHPPLVDHQLVLICRACRRDPPNIVEDFRNGDMVCGDCGLVFPGRVIDTRSEWRTFEGEGDEDPSRVGQADNPFLDGNQLDTIISRGSGRGGIAGILAKAHSKTSANRSERDLINAYKDIATLCDHMRLGRGIADVAKQLYKRARDANLFPNPRVTTEIIIAACILMACRHENYGRSYNEIVALTRVPKKDIGKCVKTMKNYFSQDANLQLKTMSPAQLVSRFANKIGLPVQVSTSAAAVANRTMELGTADGRNPVSIAAACIYFVAPLFGMPKNQKEVADAAGINDSTVRQVYRLLYADREDFVRVVQELEAKQNGGAMPGLSASANRVHAHGGVESLPLP